MRGGQLDKRIALQRKISTPSDSGQPVDIWTTTAERWADKRPVAGVERYGGEQLEAREQVEFRLRWSTDIADLQAADRIIEPASDAGNPPIRSIYDVFAVLELGRHEGFRVLTARRVVP
jgi:head-tail adaptor